MDEFKKKEIPILADILSNSIKKGCVERAICALERTNISRKRKGLENIKPFEVVSYKISIFDGYPSDKSHRKLYIAKFEDGIVKIGVSQNPYSRLRNLENGRGFKVVRRAFSTPSSDAFRVESLVKRKFKNSRLYGEYFKEEFENILKFANKECVISEDFLKEVM